jgi:hypothetical protein
MTTSASLARRAAGETLDPAQEAELEAWSSSLNPANTVQQYAVWIALKFNLPVQEHSPLRTQHACGNSFHPPLTPLEQHHPNP